ncbi:MAG: sensor histidine kinase [Chloroflexi bacterium]|nr:sensor histidine kinase [Chloroflexota bacterium]
MSPAQGLYYNKDMNKLTPPSPGTEQAGTAAVPSTVVNRRTAIRLGPRPIEPGLIQVYRLFTSARLLLLVLAICSITAENPARIQRPGLGLLETSLTLGYLSWPWLQRKMGRYYLPLALLVTSTAPIVEHTILSLARLNAGATAQNVSVDLWRVIAALFLPLILIAWQYGFRSVIVFCAGTSILEILLAIPVVALEGPPMVTYIGVSFERNFLYLMVGYLVARLMSAQRVQRDALARANAQLKQYAATIEQLSISRERNRMARELHDTLAHTLSAVSVQLEATSSLWDHDLDAARKTLDKAQTLTRNGLGEVRRSLDALRAKPLEDMGLGRAVLQLAETTADRAGLTLNSYIDPNLRTSAEIEQSVYRIAEESMTNIVRHANAQHLTVALYRHNGTLALVIEDDGLGFDPAASFHGHYGLVGMHERAVICGGQLYVQSQPQAGTTITLTVAG